NVMPWLRRWEFDQAAAVTPDYPSQRLERTALRICRSLRLCDRRLERRVPTATLLLLWERRWEGLATAVTMITTVRTCRLEKNPSSCRRDHRRRTTTFGLPGVRHWARMKSKLDGRFQLCSSWSRSTGNEGGSSPTMLSWWTAAPMTP